MDLMSAAVAGAAARSEELKPQGNTVERDGILYCTECGEPRQVKIEVNGKERLVPCSCSCTDAERDKEERERRKRFISNDTLTLQEQAFSNPAMRKLTFKLDDKKDARISDAMRRYAAGFDKYYEKNRGLLLYGTVGTGKSFYAGCIVNAVLGLNMRRVDNEDLPRYTAYMTNFTRILNVLQSYMDERQEYIDRLAGYSLLAIDDLGTERDSAYAREQVYAVINERYTEGKPLIITTNLSLSELINCTDTERKRIYDRVLEMCCPIEFKGESRRQQTLKRRYEEMKGELGL